MKSQTATLPINVLVAAVLNPSVFAVYDYLPPHLYIYAGKKVPLRVFICEKMLSLYNQKAEESNRQKS